MALDKLVNSTQLDIDLTSVANAIRTKGGTSASLAFPAGFVSAINAIQTGQEVYVSSGGLLYTPIMTINCGMENPTTGNLIESIMKRYGAMPYLEELTLTGVMRNNAASTTITPEGVFTVDNYPLLKKLYIQPIDVRNSSGGAIDSSASQYFNIGAGHYAFSYTNLRELTIGKLGGPYWRGGGYYRKYTETGTSAYTIGSTDGLTLKVYVASYLANGGFANGSVAENTTIIEYDYQTGEVLTA